MLKLNRLEQMKTMCAGNLIEFGRKIANETLGTDKYESMLEKMPEELGEHGDKQLNRHYLGGIVKITEVAKEALSYSDKIVKSLEHELKQLNQAIEETSTGDCDETSDYFLLGMVQGVMLIAEDLRNIEMLEITMEHLSAMGNDAEPEDVQEQLDSLVLDDEDKMNQLAKIAGITFEEKKTIN